MVCLVNHIQELGAKVVRFNEDINYGGCCVYASILGKELSKRNIPTRVIVASYPGDVHLDTVRAQVKKIGDIAEWNSAGVFFTHVGLEFDYNGLTFHHDTNILHEAGRTLGPWKIYPGHLSIEEATALARAKVGWNETFWRGRIPAIRSMIKYGMKQYDCFNED